MPEGYFVEVKPSKIHGNGLFATKDFKAGELICPDGSTANEHRQVGI
jgi:hypothetical protein